MNEDYMNGRIYRLGRKIKEVRKSQGFSQQELAERTGYHICTVRRMERGLLNPTLKTIESFSEALDLKSYELIRLSYEDRDYRDCSTAAKRIVREVEKLERRYKDIHKKIVDIASCVESQRAKA